MYQNFQINPLPVIFVYVNDDDPNIGNRTIGDNGSIQPGGVEIKKIVFLETQFYTMII